MSAFKPFKEPKPISDKQTVENLLLAGKSIDSDMIAEKPYSITNLPMIISRLKKKYPEIENTEKIGKKAKSIKVYRLGYVL